MFTCPKCGTVADPGTIYCDNCGFRLKGATSAPQPQTVKK